MLAARVLGRAAVGRALSAASPVARTAITAHAPRAAVAAFTPSMPLAAAGAGAARMLHDVSKIDPYAALDTFANRHIGPSEADQKEMLKVCGFETMEDLIASTVPASIRIDGDGSDLGVGEPMGETDTLARLRAISLKNTVLRSYIGRGYYGTKTPAVILRNILENPGWYTSYTPYQAEISQGRLEALLNFQTVCADLTGLHVGNASLLDEGTAAAEAMHLAFGQANKKRTKFFVSENVHPQTLAVVRTRAEPLGIELVVGDALAADFSGEDFAGVLVQYPDTKGVVQDFRDMAARAQESKTLVAAATDLLALTQLTPPGEWGADVAVGSAQRFGVPMGYGGPHAGFFTCGEKFMRKMPGRVIGISKDSRGKTALRMSMQAREQHIRRDKATSNICTAQALLANIASSYAVYHGPEGLRDIGGRVARLTNILIAGLRAGGHDIPEAVRFDTVAVGVPDVSATLAKGVEAGMNFCDGGDSVIISLDETCGMNDVAAILGVFGAPNSEADLAKLASDTEGAALPAEFARTSDFMTADAFNTIKSETQMLRYLHKLQARDLSLTHSMISLGSCTMKLNATSEMIPITWPEFANMHPFAPVDQAAGYLEMIETLHEALRKITGFAAMSTQPNSGAAGEYAGLMCIRAFHEANGEGHRKVCLIPVSAHGTNPASAAMAGMKVVTVKSTDAGEVDMEDLVKQADKHKDNLGALMVTYPSTFGVFEDGIKDIIAVVHDRGGQVYMDGANMNAQVGLTSPGTIGADVCHLNLHKTFCIPHGGGGPGVGTIGVAKHLAPFLPGHPVIPSGGEGENTVRKTEGTVASAPFGSAAILPISWMYIMMLGSAGLKSATQHAILNANYMASRLKKHYGIKFTGANGQCAHEFIMDIRPFRDTGIVEEDVAKRLIDFGFHAPTMSWPVPGTLMVEPTESEDKAELDRFCDALIQIRKDIQAIRDGTADRESNSLKGAPHTADMVLSDTWDRKYSREEAAYPAKWVREHKFWPTVGRLDNVYGDRHLVCSCPPVSLWEEDSDDE